MKVFDSRVKHTGYEEDTKAVDNLYTLLEIAMKLKDLGYGVDEINDRLGLDMPYINPVEQKG